MIKRLVPVQLQQLQGTSTESTASLLADERQNAYLRSSLQ
jgi:hypothetical protein